MPYDLTSFQTYLEESPPSEIASLLDKVLYDLILSADHTQGYETLCKKYIDVLFLRNEFAKLDEKLQDVWK